MPNKLVRQLVKYSRNEKVELVHRLLEVSSQRSTQQVVENILLPFVGWEYAVPITTTTFSTIQTHSPTRYFAAHVFRTRDTVPREIHFLRTRE